MAKSKSTGSDKTYAGQSVEEDKYSEWRVRDALDILKRAGEVCRDKKMLGLVRKCAQEQAAGMEEIASKAAMLAKAGRISPRAMEKLTKR